MIAMRILQAMNSLKVKIEIDPDIKDCEVTIRCAEVDSSVLGIQKLITEAGSMRGQISFFKDDAEFFFPVNNVLFFETDGGHIWAHTANDEFEVGYKLYELEELLLLDAFACLLLLDEVLLLFTFFVFFTSSAAILSRESFFS